MIVFACDLTSLDSTIQLICTENYCLSSTVLSIKRGNVEQDREEFLL